MTKVGKALNVYKNGGLLALLFSTWSHIGNVVYKRVLRIPIIGYVCGIFVPLQPGQSVFSPIGQVLKYYIPKIDSPYEETKIRDRPMYFDRFSEMCEFYNYDFSTYLLHYLKNGLPNTRYYKYRFGQLNRQHFGEKLHSPPPEELLAGYQAVSFWTVNRLILGYNRYDIASKYVNQVGQDIAGEKVLDYGCGVADPSLYCGLKGASVTIVDLDTTVLELAEARFESRDIEYTSYSARQTEEPIDVGTDKFDFIIMSEFLEHVRNPMVFLDFTIEHLRNGGYFYDPVGRQFGHTIHQQHLKEAKETVMSAEYQRQHRENFEDVGDDFYRKRV
jgi:SAM-dependent methyltransferase